LPRRGARHDRRRCDRAERRTARYRRGYPPTARHHEGLRRCFRADIASIRRAYRTLYRDGLALEDATTSLTRMSLETPALALLVAFFAEPGRGLIR
jgi:UDP-N-acetylglucosamine acyltransferase